MFVFVFVRLFVFFFSISKLHNKKREGGLYPGGLQSDVFLCYFLHVDGPTLEREGSL